MPPFLSLLSAIILIPAGLLFLWPTVARWLGRDDLLTALTAFGTSIGLLSLWMFALAWLDALSVWPVLGLVASGWGLGWALNRSWFRLRWLRAALREWWAALTGPSLEGLALLVMLASLAIVLVHDLYYPFLADDTLIRYALQARLVYERGGLPLEVQGSPLLVPLGFVYTWLVGNSVNEHLAKLVPFAFAAGMVGQTVLLGRKLGGQLTGLLAGAVLAVTPFFVDWAVTGYTDIPAGFYTVLATLFAIQWWEDGQRRDLLLAGIVAGLAMWAKQSAFILPVSLLGVAVVRSLTRRGAAWHHVLLDLGALLVPIIAIAGPWYGRNYAIGGSGDLLILPGLYHTWDIKPQIAGLLPPLQYPSAFGLALAPLYILGFLLALWRVVHQGWPALRGRGRGQWPVTDLVGLAVSFPYWLAWWTNFSFTPRFLLLVLPIYAVWAAWPLSWLAERAEWAKRRGWLVAPLAGLLLFVGVRNQLGTLYYAVTRPCASYEEKLVRTKGDLYPTARWLATHLEAGDRVLSMDGRLRFYLIEYDIETGYPRQFKNIAPYDYVVDFSATTAIYKSLGWKDSDYWQHRRDPAYFEEVFDGGKGSEIFRVLPAVKEAG